MNRDWLHKRGQRKIVVFCNGWGMDSNPFRQLSSSDYDVLNLYNFNNIDPSGQDWSFLAGYSERILVGWSMGVWGGQRLFCSAKELFSRTIAINGTLCPIDSRYGISPELFAGTMEAWSEISREKFYRRACGIKSVSEIFLDCQPERSLKDQQNELGYYLDLADCIDPGESIYKEIVVSDKDRIVPTVNQIEYWGSSNVAVIKGSHFLFYRWKSWDSMLSEFNEFSL